MKIAIFGASGRMGRAIAALASTQTDLTIEELIAHPHSSSLGQNLCNIPISASFQNQADLLIDMTLSRVFPLALTMALRAKKPIVIGVTGLTDAQMQEIRLSAREIPIFYTPNFSLGMAIFRRLSSEAAKRFYSSATADIIETHHLQKKDAPSGSALLLAQAIESQGKTARIHSIRSGKIIGEHSLLLNSEEERLEIAHTVHSRDAFARGALMAARFLFNKKPALYGMDDLFV